VQILNGTESPEWSHRNLRTVELRQHPGRDYTPPCDHTVAKLKDGIPRHVGERSVHAAGRIQGIKVDETAPRHGNLPDERSMPIRQGRVGGVFQWVRVPQGPPFQRLASLRQEQAPQLPSRNRHPAKGQRRRSGPAKPRRRFPRV
jgi:hypothetical protein